MSRRTIDRPHPCAPRDSRGATLIVGMILLMLMTSIALTTLKAVKTDEHLTANLQDRTLAFQAAEAALREAELDLEDVSPESFSENQGYYLYSDAGVPNLMDPSTFDANDVIHYTGDLSVVDVAEQPLYIVERMEPGVVAGDSLLMGVRYGAEHRWSYRVTSLGYGGSATTRVVLQTTFRR